MWIFYVLLLFLIIACIIAVQTDNLLSSIICVGAVGAIGSLMFLLLYAPDIAITQVVVEVLALVVMLRVTISRDVTFITGDRELFGTVASIVTVLIIFLAGIEVFRTLPAFGVPAYSQISNAVSQTYLAEGLQKTGAANIVAAIILDYRGYDTLGEATVLFTSIIGAMVILRKETRKLPEANR
jgi:multisubunit Na+/H+ antiporter MnhB subunit